MTQKCVLVLTPYLPPEGGGLERYAKRIALGLKDAHDWRVVLVSSGARGGPDVRRRWDDVTVYRLGYSWKISNTPLAVRWAHKTTQIIDEERPDVVNGHAPVPGLADIAALVSRRLPFVLTYHSGSMKKGRFPIDAVIGAYESLLLRGMLTRSQAIICSSNFVRDHLRHDRSKSVTITPGVDTTLFSPGTPPSPVRRVLFVGNFGPAHRQKGLADAIQAVAELQRNVPGVVLEVAGKGDREEYDRLATAAGMRKPVHYLGQLGAKELARTYRNAAVVVLPSYNESFGMVLLEAMACGIPVVSTTVGGIPTVVRHGHTGLLVPPGNIGDLTASLGRLLCDIDLARRMGVNGWQAAQDHSWDQKVTATHDVLSAVVS